VLSLLSEVATERPLICLVDDEQWLDRASAQALGFAARRLAADPEVSREEGLRWGWIAATVLWDEDAGRAIIARQVQLARDAGALEQLPTDLVALAMSDAWRGDFAAAASLIAETDTVAGVTGSRIAPYTQMFLASLRGSQAELASLIAVANAKAAAEGQGVAATYAQWAAAIAHNGLGRYEEALAAARQAGEHSASSARPRRARSGPGSSRAPADRASQRPWPGALACDTSALAPRSL
jgi:hypothetical protein